MKIVGLITEYNPFHNGHLYHIEEAKRVTGADTVVVVMSGDYVQRGTPAVMPKRLRTEMALKCGAGAVFELPVCYASGSAEFFAMGAVSLLDHLGAVDSICFGSESNDLEALQEIAGILLEEPDGYQELLKEALRSGQSYPSARQKALAGCTGNDALASLLDDPNNILGIEYLKALRKLNSSMVPYTILLQGSTAPLPPSVPCSPIPPHPCGRIGQEAHSKICRSPAYSGSSRNRFPPAAWSCSGTITKCSTRSIRTTFH